MQEARLTIDSPFEPLSVTERAVLEERTFQHMIAFERKRTERSGDPFLLMLLAIGDQQEDGEEAAVLEQMAAILLDFSRETDLVGWYKQGATLGMIFTGLPAGSEDAIRIIILDRVQDLLARQLSAEWLDRIQIDSHFFPDDWDSSVTHAPMNPALYPDLAVHHENAPFKYTAKRWIDVLGSLCALLCLSPFLLLIAAVIKATSKGPVFFRQPRVGQYGRNFTFLKFRSMYMNNDPSVHRAYVEKLIAGGAERPASSLSDGVVYKLTNDPRITKVGKFLRRTSLDELPQFLNVLRGEMSLVGPRPPIPYELEAYRPWHRRRILEAKPGITGLWQVTGRSRVTFDEMVRLDLQYATSWTPWMDIKILLRTPLAVIRGSGAC
jgi:lipopolysaccharide/colanic/teichoic acid biosynthesis glycosyltransferase